MADLTTARFLDSLVDPNRVRLTVPDPIIRGVTYKHIQIPDALKQRDPIILVEVESANEIAEIFKKANKDHIPIYVRQGTGWVALDITRPEPPGSIVLDLRRLNWIRPSLDSGYVEVGPAVSEHALNAALEPHGFSYPEFVGPITWGGLTSLNTSGRSVDPHWGKPGDYVLGLEVVLPTGEIVETGTRSHRRPCGVDLTWIFTGFQAMAGIITNIRLRLLPTPRNTRWGVAFIPSVEAAGEIVAKMYRQGVPPPLLMELMDQQFLELSGVVNKSASSVILIGTDGFTSTEAEAKLEAIFGIAHAQGASETTAMPHNEFQRFMGFRNDMYPESQNVGGQENLIKELGLFPIFGGVMDGPLNSMAPCMTAAGEMIKKACSSTPGLYGVRIGHIGGGTFHPVFFAPDSWEFDRLQSLTKSLRNRMLTLQLQFGCTTGEQGIFPQHYEWFHRFYGPDYASVVRRVRDAFDPQHLVNQARFDQPTYNG